ncbi:hypothetical protein CR513_19117, partial [Mucuna pruriens]
MRIVNPKGRMCHVKGKLFSIIIDGGSSVNLANLKLVEKLNLSTLMCLRPYNDEILCDVVPIEAIHILLGRPWKYDRKVTHNGVTNKFSFVHMGQKVTLKFCLQVSEAELKMQIKREKEQKE